MQGGNKGFKRICEKLQEHIHYFPYIKFYNYDLLSGMEENTCL